MWPNPCVTEESSLSLRRGELVTGPCTQHSLGLTGAKDFDSRLSPRGSGEGRRGRGGMNQVGPVYFAVSASGLPRTISYVAPKVAMQHLGRA